MKEITTSVNTKALEITRIGKKNLLRSPKDSFIERCYL